MTCDICGGCDAVHPIWVGPAGGVTCAECHGATVQRLADRADATLPRDDDETINYHGRALPPTVTVSTPLLCAILDAVAERHRGAKVIAELLGVAYEDNDEMRAAVLLSRAVADQASATTHNATEANP